MKRRVAMTLAAALVAVAVALLAYGEVLLGVAGRFLVHKDQLRPVEAVAITLDSGGAGALEAADLVHQGVSDRIVVFSRLLMPDEQEFTRRGLPAETSGDRQIARLKQLGLNDVTRVPDPVSGSHDEIEALLKWSRREGLRNVVMVTSAEHSRRLRRIIDRMNRPESVEVIVVPARHSMFESESWWKRRDGMRSWIIESEKLLLEYIAHPFVD